MCKLKSGIILKNRVFVPEYDSHTDMLEELGIEDNYLNAIKTFVRFELSPAADDDVFSDIDTWVLKIDQDIIPEWYNEEEYKPQVTESVKEWAKTHIHTGIDNLKITTGQNHYIKDCQNVVICDSATVKHIYGSATVELISGSATVELISGSATVELIYGSATVELISGSATVKHISGSATVELIYGNATVKHIYGSATVKHIYGNATVELIYGNATVKHIYGSATVKHIYGNATVKEIEDFAVLKSHAEYIWHKNKNLTVKGNATFKDCYNKILYQAGDWEMVNVESEGE